MTDILTDDFKTTPFWWEAAPRDRAAPAPLPARVDVLVVGSGYAGLHCGLETARAGRSTLVLDAFEPGFGASTRNMGHIGRYLHYPFTKLEAKFGHSQALAMWHEAGGAHAAFLAMLDDEQMQVDQHFRGRFTGACSASHYDGLAKEYGQIQKIAPELEFWMCPKSEMHKEAESDYWHGALIVEGNGMLHPGRYHAAVLDRTLGAGAQVVGHAPVTAITPQSDGFNVATRHHVVHARDVVICSNGYTRETGYTPWTRRRIVPVPAHAIATEPMAPETLKLIKPKLRSMRDSRKNVFSDRPSLDDRVLIFSALTGHDHGDQRVTARKLHELLATVYPRLKETRISHCWTGMMGFPFDKLPHMGKTRDGVHFATGFAGGGVVLATHFGKTIAKAVLAGEAPRTAFWNLGFPTWPFYTGDPWFLPAMVAWIDLKDRFTLGKPY
jgi:glycine/D-amino acid oxidase-like deaminating enzyme